MSIPKKVYRTEGKCKCGMCVVRKGAEDQTVWLLRPGMPGIKIPLKPAIQPADSHCPHCACRLGDDGFAYEMVERQE